MHETSPSAHELHDNQAPPDGILKAIKGYKSPFRYGNIWLPSNVFYSPLAGCSNLPYRQMSSLHGAPGLQYCEMVKMEALWRGDSETFRMLDYTSDMHPIGAQLVGANLKIAGACARILEDLGFDAIDLNCGCPVDKVTRDGSGSALLQRPYLIGEILNEMVTHTSLPVSIKIRAGWDESQINAISVAQIAKSAGAVALTLHARTRQQGYRGPADWSYIRSCKEAMGDFLIIGNGDVFTPQAAEKMFEMTGCDGVMASRGTLGHPWLARDIENHFLGKPALIHTLKSALQALQEHYELACNYLPERQAIIEMRKVSTWYLEPYPHAKQLRSQLAHAQTRENVVQLLNELQLIS